MIIAVALFFAIDREKLGFVIISIRISTIARPNNRFDVIGDLGANVDRDDWRVALPRALIASLVSSLTTTRRTFTRSGVQYRGDDHRVRMFSE